MIIEKEHLKQITIGGGMTREQVQILGGKYPLEKGWVKSLIGKEIKAFTYAQLMAMKIKTLKSKGVTPDKQKDKIASLVKQCAVYEAEISNYKVLRNEANDIINRYENMSMLDFIGYRLYKYFKQFVALISG